MAVRRVKTINRAAKPHRCSKCSAEIPKGGQYRYWLVGFRPSYKRIRCMRPECTPRTSELETSNVAEAYAAIENAENELNGLSVPGVDGWEDAKNDVERIVAEAGEAIYDVASGYREADESFGGQGATEHAERADTLEAASDELQGYSVDDEPEPCDEHEELREGCDDCEQAVQGWWDTTLQAAQDAVSQVEMP